MRIKAGEIAAAVKGVVIRGKGETIVGPVATDSRKVRGGEIFFALRGPNFDGHAFVREVFTRGALCAVVSDAGALDGLPPDAAVIAVKDTLAALGSLAGYWRGLHGIPLVAVSGSAGKTTTKEMIAAVLGRSRRVLKTEGNLNNLIGLPMTLFGLDGTHEAAVVELGISTDWEMPRLVEICRPDVAVITNIGKGHLQTLGSLEGVAHAKGPLFTGLGHGGVKVVNLDDPWVRRLAGAEGRAVTYSMREKADVAVKGYTVDEGLGWTDAVYVARGEEIAVRLNAPGEVNVMNAAAAIAAAIPFDVPAKEIRDGFGAFRSVKGRMEVLRINGITLLDDTYNANPESMSSALRTLGRARGRKIAVMGDMRELGDWAAEAHREAGRLAASIGADAVIAVGEYSGLVAEGAASAGSGTQVVLGFREKADALQALMGLIREGDTVMVKGSRAVGLEYIVEGLKGGATSTASVKSLKQERQ